MNTCFVVMAVLMVAVVAAADPAPIQQRIALNPTGMTVTWSTMGPISGIPQVIYGLSVGGLNTTVSGQSQHYDVSVTYFHSVELTGLTPSTTYFWAVVGDKQVLSFTTAPDASAPVPFKTMIYGDLGIDNSVDTLDRLRTLKKAQEYEMIWHVGDLNYADDHSDTPYSYEQITEGWMTNMTDIWNDKPYMLLPGNHEHTCGGGACTPGQVNFSSFRLRYNMPHDETSSATNMHYSFDYSYVHFVNVDTETYPGGPEEKGSGPFGNQTDWLIKDLTAANMNRAERPWVLVGGHRQWFSTAMGIEAQIKYFAPIFEEYQVDIVFCGHIHWYERLYALSATGEICTKSYENPKCPIYIVTGAAGNIEGLSKDEKPANITAKILSEFGIGRLNVYNGTHALWEFIKSNDGSVADSVLVVKDRSQFSTAAL